MCVLDRRGCKTKTNGIGIKTFRRSNRFDCARLCRYEKARRRTKKYKR